MEIIPKKSRSGRLFFPLNLNYIPNYSFLPFEDWRFTNSNQIGKFT